MEKAAKAERNECFRNANRTVLIVPRMRGEGSVRCFLMRMEKNDFLY